MTPLTAEILKQKATRRRALAALPYPEKVRIVEKLREASKRIAQARTSHCVPLGPQS